MTKVYKLDLWDLQVLLGQQGLKGRPANEVYRV